MSIELSSSMERLHKVSVKDPSFLMLLSVNAFGGLIFGYQMGVVAGTSTSLTDHFSLDSIEVGIYTGSFLFGAMVGSILGGQICNKYGRKVAIALVGLFSGLFSLMCGLVPYFSVICAFRVLVGVGVGLSCVACPLYVSELADEYRRGMLISAFQLFLTFGICVAYATRYIVDQTFDDPTNNYKWRIMFYLGSLFPALLVLTAVMIPESRVWYRLYAPDTKDEGGDGTEALLVNTNLRGDIRGGWTGLFSSYHRRALLIGLVLGFMQAMCGINAVLFYAPQIFEATGFKDEQALLTLLLGVWNFLSTLVAVFLVDRVGRKPLLLGGLGVMFVGLVTLTVAPLTTHGMVSSWLSFGSLFLFIFGFAVGPGAIFWVLVSEVFDDVVRGQGSSLVNLQQWTENLILTSSFPWLVAHIDIGIIFLVFAAIVFLSIVILGIFLKEKQRFRLIEVE